MKYVRAASTFHASKIRQVRGVAVATEVPVRSEGVLQLTMPWPNSLSSC